MTTRTLLVGCGRLGLRVGELLLDDQDERGRHEVLGLRRDPSSLPPGFVPVAADLSAALPTSLPRVDAMVITLTPSAAPSYREPLAHLAAALPEIPRRTVFVSSTRVLEGYDASRPLTEADPARPRSDRARVLIEGEETARDLFVADGYAEIGIDHFARPGDGLAVAQRTGRLRRNFQGYTDDQADVLIGLGASSISRFPQGYAQNAPATGAHVGAIRDGRFSTMRGHVMTPDDQWRARMIEAVMCDFRIDTDEFVRKFGLDHETVAGMYSRIAAQFGDMVTITARGLSLDERARPLTRMIAQVLDAYDMGNQAHSTAI